MSSGFPSSHIVSNISLFCCPSREILWLQLDEANEGELSLWGQTQLKSGSTGSTARRLIRVQQLTADPHFPFNEPPPPPLATVALTVTSILIKPLGSNGCQWQSAPKTYPLASSCTKSRTIAEMLSVIGCASVGSQAKAQNSLAGCSHAHRERDSRETDRAGKNIRDLLRVSQPTDAAAHRDWSRFVWWPVHPCPPP